MLPTTETRYSRALIRNVNEIIAAVFERRALVGLEEAEAAHPWNFFRVAYNALFNDMLAHCMRVLDRNQQSASFWYLYHCEQKVVDQFVKEMGIDWSLVEAMADKLKHVRDKTHFHVDRDAVKSPQAVWKTAEIKAVDLATCFDSLWRIVEFLHVRLYELPPSVPSYDGTDATRIVQAAQKAGIISQ